MADPNFTPPRGLDYHSATQKPGQRNVYLLYPLAALLFLIAVSLLIGGVSPSVSLRARITKSASQLHQIGTALVGYAVDHGGNYPDTFKPLVLGGYVATAAVFASPHRSETPAPGSTPQAQAAQLMAGGHMSYVYVGCGLTTATATPSTIVAYEIPLNPSDTVNVLCGDAIVYTLDAAHAAKAIARATNGPFPATMPSP